MPRLLSLSDMGIMNLAVAEGIRQFEINGEKLDVAVIQPESSFDEDSSVVVVMRHGNDKFRITIDKA
jgi:hypothetical protein